MIRRTVRILVWAPLGLLLALWALHPWPLPLRWLDPSTTAYMDHRVRQAAREGGELEIHHRWVPLERMPRPLVRAVLVAEDDRFEQHRGVDWEALAEEVRYRGEIPPRVFTAVEDRDALREAWRFARENREEVRGRSTITQQLARNLYLSPDRSMVRKGQEFLIARRLEFFLPKDRILEIYLNVAELGPGVFGVGAAAERYFGVPVEDLTARQAASLAATLPHPLTSNPELNPGRMAWRRDLILARLGGGTQAIPRPPPEIVEVAPPVLEDFPPPEIEPPEPEPVVDTLPTVDSLPRYDTLPGDVPPPADSLRQESSPLPALPG